MLAGFPSLTDSVGTDFVVQVVGSLHAEPAVLAPFVLAQSLHVGQLAVRE